MCATNTSLEFLMCWMFWVKPAISEFVKKRIPQKNHSSESVPFMRTPFGNSDCSSKKVHTTHINQVSSLQIIFFPNVVIQKLICHHNTRSQMLIQHHVYNLYLYLTNRLVVIICIVHILMCYFHFPFFYSSPSFLPSQPKCFGKCLTFLSFYTSTLKKTDQLSILLRSMNSVYV